MRSRPTDSLRSGQRDTGHSRARTDGAGGGLFDVTELPVVEYVSDGESPVVERVNQAFVETFDITDEMTGIPLSTTLASVTVPNDEYGPILDSARRGSETVVTCQCETATGNRSFRIRTTQADGGGYVVFTETLGSERLDVLKYLTHSLRNPLEVAAVHTEVMADTGTLDHLDTVRTAHERIDAIVTDTMELAQQGTVVEETTTVDIESLAREAWETVRTDDATLQVGSPGTVDADGPAPSTPTSAGSEWCSRTSLATPSVTGDRTARTPRFGSRSTRRPAASTWPTTAGGFPPPTASRCSTRATRQTTTAPASASQSLPR